MLDMLLVFLGGLAIGLGIGVIALYDVWRTGMKALERQNQMCDSIRKARFEMLGEGGADKKRGGEKGLRKIEYGMRVYKRQDKDRERLGGIGPLRCRTGRWASSSIRGARPAPER